MSTRIRQIFLDVSTKNLLLLKFVKTLALEIAEKPVTVKDSNVKQEAQNLVHRLKGGRDASGQ